LSIILPKTRTAIWLIIWGLIIAVFVAVLLLALFVKENVLTSAQWVMLVGELLLPLPIVIWARQVNTKLTGLLRLRATSPAILLSTVPIALGLTILTDELDRLVQLLIPTPETFTRVGELFQIKDWGTAVLIIGVVVLAAPLVEELVFRGFLQQILEYRQRDITRAVILSALVFTLVHFNPWWAIQIYILGLFMGYVAWRADTIWPSFLIHAGNNAWSVGLIHYDMTRFGYEWHGHVHPFIVTGAAVFFIVGLKLFNHATATVTETEEIVFFEDAFSPDQGDSSGTTE